jgi:hypothetical protein
MSIRPAMASDMALTIMVSLGSGDSSAEPVIDKATTTYAHGEPMTDSSIPSTLHGYPRRALVMSAASHEWREHCELAAPGAGLTAGVRAELQKNADVGFDHA